jgi:E3 ubiquitin-protein ligase RNF14
VADAPSRSELQDNSSDTSTSGSFSFTIQHLPPICLLCVLPATYPSCSPPVFTLSCLWLSPSKLSSLCASLDKIAVDYSPEVVVYTWADWLRTDSLSHLGVREKLELGPYHERGREKNINEYADERALSSSTSFDVDIARILRHNEERQNKEFLRSLHVCNICLTDHPGNYFHYPALW